MDGIDPTPIETLWRASPFDDMLRWFFMALWYQAEVFPPNRSQVSDCWIFLVRLPSLTTGADIIWRAIEELIRQENPTIGDLSSYRCALESRFSDKELDKAPHYISENGLPVWVKLRPLPLTKAGLVPR
jgi:hypothetical protein